MDRYVTPRHPAPVAGRDSRARRQGGLVLRRRRRQELNGGRAVAQDRRGSAGLDPLAIFTSSNALPHFFPGPEGRRPFTASMPASRGTSISAPSSTCTALPARAIPRFQSLAPTRLGTSRSGKPAGRSSDPFMKRIGDPLPPRARSPGDPVPLHVFAFVERRRRPVRRSQASCRATAAGAGSSPSIRR